MRAAVRVSVWAKGRCVVCFIQFVCIIREGRDLTASQAFDVGRISNMVTNDGEKGTASAESTNGAGGSITILPCVVWHALPLA